MKKIRLLVVLSTIVLVAFSINWAVSNSKMTEREKRAQVDTRIDNMAYWVKMAEEGYIPFNPNVKAEPATYIGSQINSPMSVTDDSPDVPVTEINSTQSENSIIVDPMSGNTVLNSNNSTPNPASGVYGANYLYSFDAGESFEGAVTGAGGGNSGDPAAAIGTDGRWYVGYITNPGGQGVAYSDDQGQTWTPKTVAPNPGSLADKNHLWLDRKVGSPYENYIYDAWTAFAFSGPDNNEIMMSRSIDNGLTWSSKVNISSNVNAGSHNQGVNIQTGPNGEVYAIWAIYDSWPSDEKAIAMARSFDGGETWEPATRIINNIRGIRNSGVPQNMRVNSFPTMAVDISNGPYSGNIYVSWTNVGVPGENSGSDRDVYMIKSTDGGDTWSEPIRVNQDPIGEGKAHYMAWPTVDPSSGILAFVYYSNQNTPSNQAEAWCAVSGNGGEAFDTFVVSDVAFTPTPIPGLAGQYFGDYLGMTANEGWFYPCWTDNRSGHALTYVSPFYVISNLPPYSLVASVDQETGEAILNWNYTEANDFQYFNVYREEELIGTTTELTYTDTLTEFGYYNYHVTAFYGGENESSAVSFLTQYGTSTVNIDPNTYTANVYINSTAQQTMVIRNEGVLDLTYSISPFLRTNVLNNYESAAGGGDEYISGVSINGINNTSASDNYSDFTSDCISMKSNKTYTLQVTAGNAYDGDQCGVWVDWNQNGEFDEAMILLTADESGNIFTAEISPEKGSAQGATRMRIRLTAPSENLSAYGNSPYGEVEDYSVVIADWISLNPDTGIIAPGDSLDVALIFDATGMEVGTYDDSFKLKTNDINNKTFQLFVTMNVTDLQIIASATSDSICEGEGIQLFSAADGGTSEYTYQWSSIPEGFSSDEQNPTVTPTEPTTYIVAVNDGEIIMTDSVNITVFANPQIDLGPDQVLCSVDEYVLDAGNQGSTYLWSTGDTTQSLVASGIGETMFWVEVTNETGCSKQDTVYLNFAAKPEVNLGNDTTVCQNETFTLNAGNPGSSYQWSTGATTQTIDVSGEGETMYWVNVTNEASCSQNDTIYVDFIAAPVVDLGNDTIVCQTGTITLNAGNPGSSYQWSTGQTTQSVILNASDFPVGMQTISVEVTNGAGCMSSADKLVEIRDCTGIDEFSAASLEVFPNPGSGIFNLKLDNLGNQTITVKVISITGNIVYQNQHNVNSTFKQQINLSDASEGIYTVVVEGKDLLINKKVIIRR